MRLNELSRPDNRHEAEQALQAHGYERIGRGTYAGIWARPGANTVLKLFTIEDTAYLNFIRFVHENPNPHFPKFHGKMIRVTTIYRAVRMERLVDGGQDALKAYLVERYLEKRGEQRSMMPDAWEQIQALFEEQPGLQQACDLLIGSGLLDNHEMDVCPANIMFRGNVLVLTDPLAPKGWRG